MHIKITAKKGSLKKHHRAGPNSRSATKRRKHELGEHRLYQKQKASTQKDGQRKEGHHQNGPRKSRGLFLRVTLLLISSSAHVPFFFL
jgi:hypothetical protein